MKLSRPSLALLSSLLLMTACATVPTGPSMMVLPGTGKNFDQFRGDDLECRRFAQLQVNGHNPNQTTIDPGVRNAAIGTAVGALAGAAIGGHQGAGIGAGAGLLVGSLSGAEAASSSNYGTQRNYDNAYIQCMYAKGHQVPVSGNMMRVQPQLQQNAAPPPPSSSTSYPPPPPGMR
jgi:hypothetical protein